MENFLLSIHTRHCKIEVYWFCHDERQMADNCAQVHAFFWKISLENSTCQEIFILTILHKIIKQALALQQLTRLANLSNLATTHDHDLIK